MDKTFRLKDLVIAIAIFEIPDILINTFLEFFSDKIIADIGIDNLISINTIALIIKIAFITLFYTYRVKNRVRYRVLHKDNPLTWINTVIAVIVVSMFAGHVIDTLLFQFHPNIGEFQQTIITIIEKKFQNFDEYGLIVLTNVIFLGPMVEEFIFRGVMQGYLQKISPTLAIIVTSLIFGVIHWEAGFQIYANLAILGKVFIFSSLIGLAYYTYESLLLTTIIHCAYNLVNVIGVYSQP